MTCCDMCEKPIEKSTQQYRIKVERNRRGEWIFKDYTMCKHCSEKIDKFINFERARNNRRSMCEKHSLL